MDRNLLGLRLEEALALLRAEGVSPVVVRTKAPRGEDRQGTLRVLRVRGNELTVGAFLSGPDE